VTDANGNGRGTVQRIWDAIADPKDGLAVQIASLKERQANMHEDVVVLKAKVDILNEESQRRAGARKLGKGLWAAVIALLTLAIAVLGLMVSQNGDVPVSANHKTELTIEK